jgi:hypothetical protein
MKRPYLVQRLTTPHGSTPFDFGGGLVNGGLSDEAMKMLNTIFSFDYMGSAEFEWGAVPTALQSLADLSSKDKLTKTVIDDKIYVICPTNIKDDVVAWINLAKKDKHDITKEYVGLKNMLKDDDNKKWYKGWLKIERDKSCEEPFMFFVDKEMFENTCTLFQIK